MTWRGTKLAWAALVMAAVCFAAGAQAPVPGAMDLTPPRLSFIEGPVSFLRQGADDWAPARVNTPLAPGDVLYAAERANLEMQIGPRAFARAAASTEFGLVNLEPDFIQFRLRGGQASLDLRTLPAGHTVELDTPNAVFTIEHPGYYRAEVTGEETRFITRRAGRATITVADRPGQIVSASEEVIVRGAAAPTVETYVAPPLDAWDRWNYARTDHEIEAISARYVSPGVYGAGALDQAGTWRVVPEYGPVWVPDRVAAGWAPYTTGSWVWDPRYGWSWVDDAPWGWAPFHHGRWLFIGGYWAWAPGPVIARAVYAPALVAFFGIAPGISVRIGIGAPAIAWVPLGWGEPLRPWWGGPGFIGTAWWGGWGGPRVVNNVVIQRTTIVDVHTIEYHHARTPRAVTAVDRNAFGRGPVRGTNFEKPAARDLEHVRDAHPVRPGPASLAPAAGAAVRPPASVASRPIVATRRPRETPQPWQRETPKAQAPASTPAPRVVAPPKQPDAGTALPRPSFGQQGTERPRPSQPPRLDQVPRTPPAAAQKAPERQPRALPGRPANELASKRAQAAPGPAPVTRPAPTSRPAPATRPAPEARPGARDRQGDKRQVAPSSSR